MKAKNPIVLALAVVLMSSFNSIWAENIDPCDDGSQYAWGENIGWINFEPNISEPNVGATVTEHKVIGFIWSENIGCYNWGLVSGRIQTVYPWGSKKGSHEPKVWFHDLLRKDGTPFDAAEIELIKKLKNE